MIEALVKNSLEDYYDGYCESKSKFVEYEFSTMWAHIWDSEIEFEWCESSLELDEIDIKKYL